MDRVTRILPAWKCDGVGDGLEAFAYKMAAEAIFVTFVYGAIQWFLVWVYNGVDKVQNIADTAIKAYNDLCLTTVETAYTNWFRVGFKSVNQACLDAATFKEKAIYNVNATLQEARDYIVDLIWKANASIITPVAVSGVRDTYKGDYNNTQNIASIIFNSRHNLVCKIAAGLQIASSCAKKENKGNYPGYKKLKL